jgi:RhtB (resistance to homoserine/threonine) family protein
VSGEFVTFTVVFVLALVSPGPDFIIVVRQSLTRGRPAGLACAAGIGCGLLFHVAYCVAGLSFIISESILLFNILKYLAAAYLVWLGVKALRSKGNAALSGASPAPAVVESRFQPFKTGLLTNILNPKAALFLGSLFSVVINKSTPAATQFLYGLWMIFLAVAWFSLVTLCFSNSGVKSLYSRLSAWADRVFGAVLILLGVEIALFRR